MKPDDVAGFIAASRGNHAEIMDFLRGASRKGCTGRALQLLATLSEKGSARHAVGGARGSSL